MPNSNPLAEVANLIKAGRLPLAEMKCRNRLAAVPQDASAWNLLGVVQANQKRPDSALTAFLQATNLAPDIGHHHLNCAKCLISLQRQVEAVPHLRAAERLIADKGEIAYLLGCALMVKGDVLEARDAFKRSSGLAPNNPLAWKGYGVACAKLDFYAEAIVSFEHVLSMTPNDAEVMSNLGLALRVERQYAKAVSWLRRAQEIAPESPSTLCNLGLALVDCGEFAEAEQAFREALSINSAYPEALAGLANALASQEQFEAAFQYYDDAIALHPDPYRTRLSRSLLYLKLGMFDKGWAEYEERRKLREFTSFQDDHSILEWRGEDTRAKNVLIYAEQGFGDTIQFSRYLRHAPHIFNNYTFVPQDELKALFLKCFPDVRINNRLEENWDFQIPLMSLPLAFRDLVIGSPNMLQYHRRESREWPQIAASNDLRVGIIWQGRPTHRRDQFRSMLVDDLKPILKFQGATFFSFTPWPTPAFSDAPIPTDLSPMIRNFSDTASALEQIDLVISVDTAIAHLAGTMGKEVWILLPAICDWRWGLEGDTTALYPTARLFRQRKLGDWSDVVEAVGTQLRACPGGCHEISQPWDEPIQQEMETTRCGASRVADDAAGGHPRAARGSPGNGQPGSLPWLDDASASPSPRHLPFKPFRGDETP